MMEMSPSEAAAIALTFLMDDLGIAAEDREFFAVLSARNPDREWYVVEIGIEGLPDKWVIQVLDTQECDPCYTFISPVAASASDTGLEDYPEELARIVAAERQGTLHSP